MTEITPEKVAATPPTPENVAEMLTSADNDYHDGNYWHPSIGAAANVVHIGITAYSEDGDTLPEVHFRAVVFEGETVPDLAEVDRLRAKLDAPCGSCHPCTNYADETWRAAGRTPPHVYAWDETRVEVDRLTVRLQTAEVDRLNAELGWLRDVVNGVGGISAGLPDSAEAARLRQAVNAYQATLDRVATVPGITVGGDGETYEIVRRSDLNIALGLTADGRGVS